MDAVLERREQEKKNLYECRVRWFRDLGFTATQAAMLAELGCDHHDAERLLERGCPLRLAFKLLS